MIYHITHKSDWLNTFGKEFYEPSSIVKEGFIHCSPAEKILDSCNNFFKHETGLLILCIDESKLRAEIKWEDLYDTGFNFPHIYGKLNKDAVIKTAEIGTDINDEFMLPEDIFI
ncbi:MAG: DUF952 domain-containing protein [Ignavibacteria bacterium]|nr:DUF952 domain-containing protein [Ignavibacteria bacterium]